MAQSVSPVEPAVPGEASAPGLLEHLLPAAQTGGGGILLSARPDFGSELVSLRRRPDHWSVEEDERLTKAVKVHGGENWALVARDVGTRSRSQCAQRWNRGLSPKINKGTWSFEEEQRLIDAVATIGTKAWTRVANAMGNRSDVQCRWRYRFLEKKANAARAVVRPIAPHAVQDPAECQLK
jgi:hypothetical protein